MGNNQPRTFTYINNPPVYNRRWVINDGKCDLAHVITSPNHRQWGVSLGQYFSQLGILAQMHDLDHDWRDIISRYPNEIDIPTLSDDDIKYVYNALINNYGVPANVSYLANGIDMYALYYVLYSSKTHWLNAIQRG